MRTQSFEERRKQYRLPFEQKIIFTDNNRAFTSYASNISRGGVFVTSLDPFPIDTTGHLAFFLPEHSTCLCVRAKVVHIVFDRQRCDVECGMGFQILELDEIQKSLLHRHIMNAQTAYLELKRILADPIPDPVLLASCCRKLPGLEGSDLLQLRYRVNRICAIFEPTGQDFSEVG